MFLIGEQRLAFWAKVDRRGVDECWPYLGGRDQDGYGLHYVRSACGCTTGRGRGKRECLDKRRHGRSIRAHRLAWEIRNGEMPSRLVGRHVVCDNPPCCNPSHIAPGTPKENSEDCIRHGRRPRGERHGRAKATADRIRLIRAEYRRGVVGLGYISLGRKHGLSPRQLKRIVERKQWGDAE